MLDDVIRALQNDSRFSAWQVTDVRGRSHQRYQVFREVEARREVEQHTCEVRVHVAHQVDGKDVLGESSFAVVDARAPLGAELDLAFARARLVKNRPWTLPGSGDGGRADVVTVDARIVERPGEATEEIAREIVRAVDRNRGVELSASEVFCDYRRVHLVNSRGLDLTREETSAYTEYVLLAKLAGSDEIEAYQSKRGRRLADLELAEQVDGDVQATADSLRASLPQTGIVDVVIGGQGTEELFDAFTAHATGPAAFEGWSRFKSDTPIVEDVTGDRLSIESDATLEGGLMSFAFDDVGLPGRRIALVKDGVFQARACDQRYSAWLGVPATGTFGNVVVASGTRTEQELLVPGARPLYQLNRFSQLSPHATTGAFSGEIRLGYRIDPDGTRTPIRGGSVSGSVFDAFRRAHLSVERAVRGRTHGPRSVRLDSIQLTGA